jgi:hypothetical protein
VPNDSVAGRTSGIRMSVVRDNYMAMTNDGPAVVTLTGEHDAITLTAFWNRGLATVVADRGRIE